MKIIEQALTAKNPRKKSEDGIVVTDDFVAVIDGSTSKSTYQHTRHQPFKALMAHAFNASNGRYAMLLTASYIRHMGKNTTCEQFMRGVTAHIRKHYSETMMQRLTDHPEDRMTCSVIIFSRLRREIWMIGDCQGLLTPCHPSSSPADSIFLDNPKPAEAELAEKRAAETKRLLAEGHSIDELRRNDKARATIIPRMLETMLQQNISYSVIDGFPIAKRYVRVITLDFQSWNVVLASDGYPHLRATLAESEQALEQQRLNDPLNIGDFKATKAFHPDFNSFDDRAYIRFVV